MLCPQHICPAAAQCPMRFELGPFACRQAGLMTRPVSSLSCRERTISSTHNLSPGAEAALNDMQLPRTGLPSKPSPLLRLVCCACSGACMHLAERDRGSWRVSHSSFGAQRQHDCGGGRRLLPRQASVLWLYISCVRACMHARYHVRALRIARLAHTARLHAACLSCSASIHVPSSSCRATPRLGSVTGGRNR
jgi:hypothetical protein